MTSPSVHSWHPHQFIQDISIIHDIPISLCYPHQLIHSISICSADCGWNAICERPSHHFSFINNDVRSFMQSPSVYSWHPHQFIHDILISLFQGWAQDLLGRDRDRDRDLSSRDRDETETFAKLSETRPRRDRDETLECPRRDRDETFFWSRLYRDTWLINAWYICTSHCVPKKESLKLGWKKRSKQIILD
jgi:hypothetical protein